MLTCVSQRRKDFVDCVDSMLLALDRLQNRAAVSGIVDFRNHKTRGISLLFSFCNRARFPIYILKNQLFALKYTLKHSLIKIISTPTCFGLIRPSSVSCLAWLLSYLEQITFVLGWLCSSLHLESG